MNPALSGHPVCPGPGRHNSPQPGSFVEAPQSARPPNFAYGAVQRQATFPPPMGVASLPNMAPLNGQVVHQIDVTMPTVPNCATTVPVPVSPIPMPKNVERLESAAPMQMETLLIAAANEAPQIPSTLTTARGCTTWLQRSAAGDRGAIIRQHSARVRHPSCSPSRSELTLARRVSPPDQKALVAVREHTLKEGFAQQAARSADALESFNALKAEIRSMKDSLPRGSESDNKENVRNELKTARSTGDLRYVIRRAEEMQMPEDEVDVAKGRLAMELHTEQEKAATENVMRAAERRRTEEQIATLKHEVDRAFAERDKSKSDLRREEYARQQLVEEKHAVEEERSKYQVRYDSLTRQMDEKIMENADMKRQISQNQVHEGRLQQALRDNRQQVETLALKESELATTRRELAAKRSENERFAAERTSIQSELERYVAERDPLMAELNALRGQLNKLHEHQEQREQETKVSNQENKNLKQRLISSDASNQELAMTNHSKEIQLRKANWSSSNLSPADFAANAQKRENDGHFARKNAQLKTQVSELRTQHNEYKARYEVLWQHLPDDKMHLFQRDLEATLQRSRNNVAAA